MTKYRRKVLAGGVEKQLSLGTTYRFGYVPQERRCRPAPTACLSFAASLSSQSPLASPNGNHTVSINVTEWFPCVRRAAVFLRALDPRKLMPCEGPGKRKPQRRVGKECRARSAWGGWKNEEGWCR